MARLIGNIEVGDLETAARFYTRAIGLRVGRSFGPAGLELLGDEARSRANEAAGRAGSG